MEEKAKSSELKEVTKELFGWVDNKLFRTLSHLTTRPGQINVEYCRGEKQKYLSPIVYYFGVTALEGFLASAIGLLDAMLKDVTESLKIIDSSLATDKITDIYTFLVSEIGQKITFLPILLLATWLIYRKNNPSIKDNSWFTLYTVSHGTLLALPLMLLWYILKDLDLYTYSTLTIVSIYWIWASKQFYNISIGKAVLLRIVWLVIIMLVVSLVGVIVSFLL